MYLNYIIFFLVLYPTFVFASSDNWSAATFPKEGVCTTTGFCFDQGSTPFVKLVDVFIDQNGDVYTVGESGSIWRYSSSVLSGFYGLRPDKFTAVASDGPNNIWVVSETIASNFKKTELLYYDGYHWADITPPEKPFIRDLAIDSAGKLWAVGDKLFVKSWTPQSGWVSPSFSHGDIAPSFSKVQVQGDNLILLGYKSNLLYKLPINRSGSLDKIVDSTVSDFTVTSSSEIYYSRSYYDRDGWKYYHKKLIGSIEANVNIPNSGSGFWVGSRADNIDYLLTANGNYHFNGLDWNLVSTKEAKCAYDVTRGHGNGNTSAFITSGGQLAVRNNESSWNYLEKWYLPGSSVCHPRSVLRILLNSQLGIDFTTQDGDSRTNRHNMSSIGVSINGKYVNTIDYMQSNTSQRTYFSKAPWSPGGKIVYLTRCDYDSYYKMCLPTRLDRFDGTSWNTVYQDSTHNKILHELDGTSETDLWAVGTGRIAHWDGETLKDVIQPFAGTGTNISKIRSVSPTLAFAIAGENVLLKWDGSSWNVEQDIPMNDSTKIIDIWKNNSGSIYILGSFGLMKYANGIWSDMGLPKSNGLYLWGTNDESLHVAIESPSGSYDWNGQEWNFTQRPELINSKWAKTIENTTYIGVAGQILKKTESLK